MIWELAVPARLLRFEGVSEETHVPSALSVPAVAHVCRESRRVVMSRKRLTALSGRSTHSCSPSQLWRMTYGNSACWTWYTPYTDVLLINGGNFWPCQQFHSNQGINFATKHIVIENCELWTEFWPGGIVEEVIVQQQLINWLREVPPLRGYPSSTRDPSPSYNLRTVDFAMGRVVKIDRNFPRNFVRRLFAGDHIRIIDLRDEETVHGIERMFEHERCQVTDSCNLSEWPSALKDSLATYKAAADFLFPYVRTSLLTLLAGAYHEAPHAYYPKSGATLPSPSGSNGELDLKVTWVKELTKRVSIRPVHVFIRAEGTSSTGW